MNVGPTLWTSLHQVAEEFRAEIFTACDLQARRAGVDCRPRMTYYASNSGAKLQTESAFEMHEPAYWSSSTDRMETAMTVELDVSRWPGPDSY